jgi:hypothetical protein
MRGGAKMSTENVMMIIIIVLIVIIVVYWLYNSTKIESFGPIDDCYGNCKLIKDGCIKEQQGLGKKADLRKCNSDNCMKACEQKNNYDNRDNRNKDKPNAPTITPSQACYNSLYDCITKSDKMSNSVSTCISNNKQNICKEIPDRNSEYAKSLERSREKSLSDSYAKIYNPCREACRNVDLICRGDKPNESKVKECYDKHNVCLIACDTNKM